MKKKNYLSNSRLYVTEDTHHEDVWFIRTDIEMFARLKMSESWEVYFYKDKITLHFDTLKESIRVIEKLFKEYWHKTYGERN